VRSIASTHQIADSPPHLHHPHGCRETKSRSCFRNRLEAFKGDRAGQWSIRINDQWRICFAWNDGNAFEVEVTDYHEEEQAMAEERYPPNPHVGDFIREDFMKPWGMTAYRLAKGLGITQTHLAQILKGERRITAENALRLEAFLGCSARMWLGMQAAHDLREARRKLGDELQRIKRYEHQGPVCDEEGNPFPEESLRAEDTGDIAAA
jgi:addiction module HigA family antidote